MDREPDATATALVPGVHRVIRVLDADEGPFRGSLVTNGSGVAVLVDSAVYAGWGGWALAGCEHVAGPLDLVRRADGHDVLLPWCVERVEAFLGRRSAADALLVAGETSTLVVSLLRGMDEHAEHGEDGTSGTWWLTEAGRPMFVIGEGDEVKAASARIIDRLRRDCGDRVLGRVLAAVHDALVEGRVRPRPSTAQLARWEAELFEIAAPRALVLHVQSPERVRDNAVAQRAWLSISSQPTRRGERRGLERERSNAEGPVAHMRTAGEGGAEFVRGVGAWIVGIAGSVRRAREPGGASPDAGVRIGGVRREDGQGSRSAPASSRRRALLVAGGAAAAVLAGGLLWPGGATGQSDAGGTGTDPESSTSATTVPSPGATAGASGGGTTDAPPGEGPSTPAADEAGGEGEVDRDGESSGAEEGASDDPVAAARDLLEEIRACDTSDDVVCGAAVASGSVGVVESMRPILGGGTEPSIALIDVYGDIAVVRVGVPSGTAQTDGRDEPGAAGEAAERMLVLIRHNDNWLVRDAYDVADQPG